MVYAWPMGRKEPVTSYATGVFERGALDAVFLQRTQNKTKNFQFLPELKKIGVMV